MDGVFNVYSCSTLLLVLETPHLCMQVEWQHWKQSHRLGSHLSSVQVKVSQIINDRLRYSCWVRPIMVITTLLHCTDVIKQTWEPINSRVSYHKQWQGSKETVFESRKEKVDSYDNNVATTFTITAYFNVVIINFNSTGDKSPLEWLLHNHFEGWYEALPNCVNLPCLAFFSKPKQEGQRYFAGTFS